MCSCVIYSHHNKCVCATRKALKFASWCFSTCLWNWKCEAVIDLHVWFLPMWPRHKIEKQYAEDTIKLARGISGKDEIGYVCVRERERQREREIISVWFVWEREIIRGCVCMRGEYTVLTLLLSSRSLRRSWERWTDEIRLLSCSSHLLHGTGWW